MYLINSDDYYFTTSFDIDLELLKQLNIKVYDSEIEMLTQVSIDCCIDIEELCDGGIQITEEGYSDMCWCFAKWEDEENFVDIPTFIANFIL